MVHSVEGLWSVFVCSSIKSNFKRYIFIKVFCVLNENVLSFPLIHMKTCACYSYFYVMKFTRACKTSVRFGITCSISQKRFLLFSFSLICFYEIYKISQVKTIAKRHIQKNSWRNYTKFGLYKFVYLKTCNNIKISHSII